jgi:hypothetical protein
MNADKRLVLVLGMHLENHRSPTVFGKRIQSPNKILIPRVEHPPQPSPIIQRLNPPLLPAILDSTDPLGLNMFRDLQHQMRQIGTLDSLPARYLPLILWKYGTFNFDANTRLIARYGKTGVCSPKIGQEDLRWLLSTKQIHLVQAFDRFKSERKWFRAGEASLQR